MLDTETPNLFTEIEVPTRPLRRIQIDVPDGFSSTNYVVDQINALEKLESFKNSIVKIDVKLLDADLENINRAIVEETLYNLGVFYICNLSESRNISVVARTSQQIIDNKIDTKAAVKIWAEHDVFEDDQEKSEYIDLANKFVESYEVKYS